MQILLHLTWCLEDIFQIFCSVFPHIMCYFINFLICAGMFLEFFQDISSLTDAITFLKKICLSPTNKFLTIWKQVKPSSLHILLQSRLSLLGSLWRSLQKM